MPTDITAQHVFELYVEQLVGSAQVLDDLLVTRLRWFSEDIQRTVDRLKDDPRAAVQLVQHLSTLMQELDATAGAAELAHTTVAEARKWALLLPETTIHGD